MSTRIETLTPFEKAIYNMVKKLSLVERNGKMHHDPTQLSKILQLISTQGFDIKT